MSKFPQALRDKLSPHYRYWQTRSPKRWGWVNSGANVNANIQRALDAQGIPPIDFVISPDEYRAYFSQAEYRTRYPDYFYPVAYIEKSLEHFIAQKLLGLTGDDVYVDIASDVSPVPEIYHRLYGCKTYAQDLAYPAGIHGDRIGGDAAALPLPDGAVNKMALHCSFEHFEGDADTRFIRECARVLAPGGRVVIVPLYLSDIYAIHTDPAHVHPRSLDLERDAEVGFVRGWGNRFGRAYDAAHLKRRVMEAGEGLNLLVLSIGNGKEVDESCYVRWGLMIEKG